MKKERKKKKKHTISLDLRSPCSQPRINPAPRNVSFSCCLWARLLIIMAMWTSPRHCTSSRRHCCVFLRVTAILVVTFASSLFILWWHSPRHCSSCDICRVTDHLVVHFAASLLFLWRLSPRHCSSVLWWLSPGDYSSCGDFRRVTVHLVVTCRVTIHLVVTFAASLFILWWISPRHYSFCGDFRRV